MKTSNKGKELIKDIETICLKIIWAYAWNMGLFGLTAIGLPR